MGALTKLWASLLLALVLAQTAASLLMPRGESLIIASDLIQGTLLLVGTAAFLTNVSRSRSQTLHIRLFWILMSTGMFFWLAYQGMWNYFEVLKRQEVPDQFDVVLFLHLVPMIAALAVFPHLREDERDERIRVLDFTLLLTWWVFIYVYAVIPWQTVQVDETAYSVNFNFAYLTEKLVLLGALAYLAHTARGGWRQLYGQLLGASALYASSSYVANWAIEHKLYYSGSLYDIPLTISIAWMATVPLLALRLDLSDSKPSRPVLGVWITRLSMLALFSLLWAAMHSELDPTLAPSVKAFRITVSLLAMIVMGVVVFWRQRLLRAELSLLLERSRRSFDDLKALQEKLIQSEKLASLGQLVGGAAHEINNPLTAMLGYSDLLSASNLPPEEELQAAQMGEQVRRTTTLVASLLTFARQAPARLSAVDINSVLQTTVRLLGPESHPSLVVRTHTKGNLVLVDFCSSDPSSQTLSYPLPLDTEGANQRATLSLSACCRIVEEHGGRILQPSTALDPAFRMELQVAPSSASRASLTAYNWAAARSGS